VRAEIDVAAMPALVIRRPAGTLVGVPRSESREPGGARDHVSERRQQQPFDALVAGWVPPTGIGSPATS
jgi:hypothetical protein